MTRRGMGWIVRTAAAAVVVAVGVVSVATPAASAAQPVGVTEGLERFGPLVELVLDNGDRIKGIYSETVDGSAMIEHPVLGTIAVPIVRIVEVLPAQNISLPAQPPPGAELPAGTAEPAKPSGDPPQTGAVPADAGDGEAALDHKRTIFDTWRENGWKGSVDIGIDGSEGNTDNQNFRGALGLVRETEKTRLTFGSTYVLKKTDDEETDNRFEAKLRHDWLLGDSPWEIFAQGEIVIDEFKDYDYRWATAAGVGYKFIDNDKTFFIGRAGAGVSQEVGAEEDDITPEAFLGYEYRHKLTERFGLATSGEIYPNLEDGGEFRSAIRGAIEYDLSNETDLRLKLGVEHRYESQVADGTRNSDLDYFLSLVLGF